MLPARLVTHAGYEGFANEIGSHTPELQRRAYDNAIAQWCGRFLTCDGRHPTPESHLDIWDVILNDRRAVIRMPRSYGKTTVAGKDLGCYLACEYPNLLKMDKPPIYPHNKAMFLSWAGAKAREVLRDIKYELENNERIKNTYGDLRGDKWHEDLIITRDGFQFKVGGRGTQVRGFRPTLLICDDLDDDEEVESDERLEKAFKWWDKAVMNTIDEDDYQVFVIGTTLEEVSLLTYIADIPSFKDYTYQAYIGGIQESGRELWPSKWPHEKLQRRKADIDHGGQRAFAAEFMNEPQPSESPIFEREWFQQYEADSEAFRKVLKDGVHTVITCDPAISRADGSDYTAIVTLSATLDKDPDIYLRVGGVKRAHWTLATTTSQIFNLYDEFQAAEIGVEAVAYQRALADEVRKMLDECHRHAHVRAIQVDTDKERRANRVAPMVQRCKVFVDYSDPMHKRAVDECVLFKPGKKNIKKDVMDALVHGLQMLMNWGGRKRPAGPIVVLPEGVRHSKVTGRV